MPNKTETIRNWDALRKPKDVVAGVAIWAGMPMKMMKLTSAPRPR